MHFVNCPGNLYCGQMLLMQLVIWRMLMMARELSNGARSLRAPLERAGQM